MAKSFPCTTELVKLESDNDNEYALIQTVPIKTHVQKFIPDQEIDNVFTIDGRKVKNIFRFEGNKLIEEQIEENKRVVKITREFDGKKMNGLSEVNDIKNRHWSSLIE